MIIFDTVANSDFFSYVILPFLIFLSRIAGQSISIIRLIFASKGYKKIVFFIGFFESLIWVLTVGQIMKNFDNIFCYIAFSLGFAFGNFIGVLIEEKISIGTVIIRVILQKNTKPLLDHLRKSGHGVTSVDAKGMNGDVKIIFTTVKRKEINNIIDIINNHTSNAFYTIEEVKKSDQGYFMTSGTNI